MKKITSTIFLLIALITLSSCVKIFEYDSNKVNITTTTNLMANLAYEIGGEHVNVYPLMGPGVDPHQYVARPNDYLALDKADLILANGLHLEGKMVEIFKSFSKQENKHVLVIGDNIKNYSDISLKEQLIINSDFGDNYDPHFWFNIELFKEAAFYLKETLINLDSKNIDYYTTNYNNYLEDLDNLKLEVEEMLKEIPLEERYLISAHDAFEYFGKEFNFEILALQGLSTESEISPSDIREMINYIVLKDIKTVFPETSVPIETIKALTEALKRIGHPIVIGNNLYSDSLGDSFDDNTYILMYKKNVKSIVDAYLESRLLYG